MIKFNVASCPADEIGAAANPGNVFVISGPSGSGKSTIYRKAFQVLDKIEFSVSCTTRSPRPGEVNGRDYHFISKEQFEKLLAEDAFAEHAEVHGNYYGTLKSELLGRVERGIDVLLDIDVQGAAQLREICRKDVRLASACVFIFIAPPSLEELKRRLTLRGTESQEIVALRLRNAENEMARRNEYDMVIVNDDINQATEMFISIVNGRRK